MKFKPTKAEIELKRAERLSRKLSNKDISASENAIPNVELIYFMAHHSDYTIRVGWTGDKHNRIAHHEAYGYQLKASRPGSYHDEQTLHAIFRSKGWLSPAHTQNKNGNSTSIYIGCDELYDYISTLLMLGYATNDLISATHLPDMDIIHWEYGSALLKYIDRDGWPFLLGRMVPRERIEYASDFAILQSKSDEWFTGAPIIEAAKLAMGSIDTDPATCFNANKRIQAKIWYTIKQDGLALSNPWKGNVFLNPPYGRGDNRAELFVNRLISEYKNRNVSQAVVCLNLNSWSSDWFIPLRLHGAAFCVCRGRPNYDPPNKENKKTSAPTKGTVLVYLGNNVEQFAKAFQLLGETYIQYQIK